MSVETSENPSQFLAEVLRCIASHQGAAEPVYQFLNENQERLNDRLLQALPTIVSALFSKFPEEQKQPIAAALTNFGRLIQEFPAGQQEVNIELAIAAYQQALQIFTHETSPITWAMIQTNLGSAYYSRIREDRAENLEQAINAFQQALRVYSQKEFPVQWASVQNNLGSAYSDRIRHDRAENLEQAIASYQQALKVRTREQFPIEWATTQTNLGSVYSERIRGDRAENLERAIDALQQALQVVTHEEFPIEWAAAQKNLGNAYSERIEGDTADNLEQALVACQQALRVYLPEEFPVDWATTQINLGTAYRNLTQGDRSENLERSITAYQQAMPVITREKFPIEWATLQSGMGNAYYFRLQGDRAENLEQAIALYQQALQVFTHQEFPIQWAMIQNNLSNAYTERIRADRSENLEQAIEASQHALQVLTHQQFPIEWSKAQNNLGNAYSDRLRGNRAENLEWAIEAYYQALRVRTREKFPIQWASTQNNLGTAYRERIRGDRPENLEQAIDAYQKALQVYTPEQFPVDWAMTQNNLGNAYSDRLQGNLADNLELAIHAYQKALQVYTPEQFPVDWAMTQNNLGNVYSKQVQSASRDKLDLAIAAYQQALQVYTPELLPNSCRGTARSLGNLYADHHCWTEAVAAYKQAIQATELLYQASILRSGQEIELVETDNLFRQAAFAQAKANDLQAAAVTLERGRARGLSETLERDRADLTQLAKLSPDRYQQYQTAVEALRQLESEERLANAPTRTERLPLSSEELRQRADQIRQAFRTVIESIRQLSGYENFLAQPDFNDIVVALQPDQPLVYLTPTTNGSLSLILEAIPEGTSIQPVWQETFTETDLRTLLFGVSNDTTLGGWFEAYSNQQTNRDAWLATMDQVTERLWSDLMEPIVSYLSQLGVNQSVLIPTGLLVFLPLHAAWTMDGTCPTGRHYALDTIRFSYIPNAQSLQTARAIADRTLAHALLAVDEPRPTTAMHLPNSVHEVQMAIASLPAHTLLRHEQATRSAMQELLPQHTALHFSGHGFAQLDSPLDSGLVMAHDEILTLRDLLDLKLPGIRLAILSACETGLPGTQLPDEVISLPTGLLQAGVAGVVASLWSVADISTMMLLVRFYSFWQEDNLNPAEALCQAQQWVRDTTNGEKLAYFKCLMQESSASKTPASTVDYLYKALIFSRPGDRDFAHPFHWAAFNYVGA
ncbi:MAG: CHAT domain-containing protein [Leptolyngbya sp. BL-A-14]